MSRAVPAVLVLLLLAACGGNPPVLQEVRPAPAPATIHAAP